MCQTTLQALLLPSFTPNQRLSVLGSHVFKDVFPLAPQLSAFVAATNAEHVFPFHVFPLAALTLKLW